MYGSPYYASNYYSSDHYARWLKEHIGGYALGEEINDDEELLIIISAFLQMVAK